MATPITFNGSSYNVPAYGDSGWAQGAGNLSAYLIAIAAGTLQTTGGTFTLSAEAYFGATYGLKAAWFKTATATPSTTGVLRLAKTDAPQVGLGLYRYELERGYARSEPVYVHGGNRERDVYRVFDACEPRRGLRRERRQPPGILKRPSLRGDARLRRDLDD